MNLDKSKVSPVEQVVTGCPRSGTLFTAHLLNWKHEWWYGIHRLPKRKTELRVGPATTPDVSWLAAPYLTHRRAMVFHLTRNPFEVVRSNAAIHWLRPDDPWGIFAHSHVDTWDPWLFWLRWNELCLSSAVTQIRLEDISHLGPAVNTCEVRGIDVQAAPTPLMPDGYEREIRQMIIRLGYEEVMKNS